MLRTLRARFFADEEEAPESNLTAPPSLAMAASVVALGFLGSRVLGLLSTERGLRQCGLTAAPFARYAKPLV